MDVVGQEGRTIECGKPFQLKFTSAEDQISACAIKTPYGKIYSMFPGVRFENGRITMHDEGSLSKFECLVLVASAQMEDAGDWTCVISFLTSDGFKSMSKSIRIKVKDIGGHLTTTDSGMSRGSSTSVDSLDEILRNLADVMATEPNRNDQQEQLSSPCYSVNYSSDSVSLAVKTKQSCMQYLNT